jgi:hypothetical protein
VFAIYLNRSLVFVAHDTHLLFLFWEPYSIKICFYDFAYVCYGWLEFKKHDANEHFYPMPQKCIAFIMNMNITSDQPRHDKFQVRHIVVRATKHNRESQHVRVAAAVSRAPPSIFCNTITT